jgi:hypothetical protein
MYLLEGTADLQHHLHLKMGDVLIFAQKEDSTIVLAGRPPTKADAVKKPTMRRASPSPLGRPAGGRRDAVSSHNHNGAAQAPGLAADMHGASVARLAVQRGFLCGWQRSVASCG